MDVFLISLQIMIGRQQVVGIYVTRDKSVDGFVKVAQADFLIAQDHAFKRV